MSGPIYINRKPCFICGAVPVGSVNDMNFCEAHSETVFMMQIEILSLESGAPTELIAYGVAELMADIADDDSGPEELNS